MKLDILKGNAASAGVAIGPVYLYQPGQNEILPIKIENVSAEIKKFESAVKTALSQLDSLYNVALSKIGEKEAEIFSIHAMMLEDEDYTDSIVQIIEEQHTNAEYAVDVTAASFMQMLTQTDNPYTQSRAADIRDISDRLIENLSGVQSKKIVLRQPSILFAEDLTPSQTLQLDKDNILAFVTQGGSYNSHTAILAKTMGIPAVVGVSGLLCTEYAEANVIADGDKGIVYLSPDLETVKIYTEKLNVIKENNLTLKKMIGKETITPSGKKINLYANVGGISDIDAALQNDAEGIGLFRSEFIYIERNRFPTEDEQFEIYRSAAEKMAGKTTIIRTLDIGADKQVSYFPLAHEENPALGLRGIRLCLCNHEIFKTQLRAIIRASAFGKIAIMFPMIISVSEIKEIKAIICGVKQELAAEQQAFDDKMEIGVMIETPAAALVSDELAAEVDFFSIGTNDLIQYTLAVDRQNARLDRFYNPHHKAVLDLVGLVVKNAHNEGIWVGICGELASDTKLTEKFIAMGIDELSVTPTKLLELRQTIRAD